MAFPSLNTQMRQLLFGNLLLLICSFFYLAWWIIAFRPGGEHGIISTILLIIAFLTGVVGLFNMITAMSRIPCGRSLFAQKTVIWGGILIYIATLLITYYAFSREITSELLLIIGWGMLELSTINIVYGADHIGFKTALVLCIIIDIAVVLSLVCYVLYYRLNGTASYVDGMLPLIMEALVMIGVIITIYYT
ncbi:MAG: hypothetical protein Q4F05_02300 [bacterium]|nr:hypothetical protein [bacterium]